MLKVGSKVKILSGPDSFFEPNLSLIDEIGEIIKKDKKCFYVRIGEKTRFWFDSTQIEEIKQS